MTLLLAISLIGFLLSSMLHIFSLFNIYDPPKQVMTLLPAGVIITAISYSSVMKKLKKDQSMKEFNRAMRNAVPEWIAVTTGFIILYGLLGLLLAGVGRYHSDTGIAGIYYHSFSSHWMAAYVLLSSLFYSAWCLNKTEGADE